MRAWGGPVLAAAFLFGCEGWEQDGLTARTASPAAGMSCAACHAYPLLDTNHAYHLFEADTLRIAKNINGRITCSDCHAGAIRTEVHMLFDSICVDALKPSGWSSIDLPGDFRACMAGNPLARVDTIRQNRPVPVPGRPGRPAELREWVTGLAHLNGRVDVKFDPRVTDTLVYPEGAEWSPEAMTCSAVACHEHPGHYRWPVPSRGWTLLRGHEDH